ncbi:MAG: hypothetical protein ACTSPI_00655 [Candidatus Heimdallarchaeaceae archaeon]
MPLPRPRSDENHDEFIGRCMSDEVMKREFSDTDQRYAVCESLWDRLGKEIVSMFEKLRDWRNR